MLGTPMKLRSPDVTLVMIDKQCHELRAWR
jgi:hypothetical protein